MKLINKISTKIKNINNSNNNDNNYDEIITKIN